MSDPWVVVVGTLGGVILTSVTGLIGIILTTRHQHTIAELGAQREVEDRLRKERRETFVNYLAAYQEMYGKALAIATSRFQGRSEDEPFPLGPSFLERAPEKRHGSVAPIMNCQLPAGRILVKLPVTAPQSYGILYMRLLKQTLHPSSG